MTKEELLEKANSLPLAPGVYLMHGKDGEVIYVALVVLQKDVVPGHVLLDERVLQHQRLELAAHDDGVEVVHQPDHGVGLDVVGDIGKERPCLNHHMGRCDGFCRSEMTGEEYNRRIDLAVQLTKG